MKWRHRLRPYHSLVISKMFDNHSHQPGDADTVRTQMHWLLFSFLSRKVKIELCRFRGTKIKDVADFRRLQLFEIFFSDFQLFQDPIRHKTTRNKKRRSRRV